jgi:hypothetical protein
MPAAGPRIVTFFRADQWSRMRRILLAGPGALTLGGVVIAFSFLTHQPSGRRVDFAAAGFVLIAGGAIYTLVGMQRILRDDVSLVLRNDGVAVQSSARETFIAWDELTDARWDSSRSELVLERAAGDPVVIGGPFARIGGRELVATIVSTRRKAALNLLR